MQKHQFVHGFIKDPDHAAVSQVRCYHHGDAIDEALMRIIELRAQDNPDATFATTYDKYRGYYSAFSRFWSPSGNERKRKQPGSEKNALCFLMRVHKYRDSFDLSNTWNVPRFLIY
mmetsp:Transcript_13517/g.22397  ORF Transcript_13517/g.22397 Transcript_13517/m.22397 type:complete len:116 (-) Transcript_13517:384-731(-)